MPRHSNNACTRVGPASRRAKSRYEIRRYEEVNDIWRTEQGLGEAEVAPCAFEVAEAHAPGDLGELSNRVSATVEIVPGSSWRVGPGCIPLPDEPPITISPSSPTCDPIRLDLACRPDPNWWPNKGLFRAVNAQNGPDQKLCAQLGANYSQTGDKCRRVRQEFEWHDQRSLSPEVMQIFELDLKQYNYHNRPGPGGDVGRYSPTCTEAETQAFWAYSRDHWDRNDTGASDGFLKGQFTLLASGQQETTEGGPPYWGAVAWGWANAETDYNCQEHNLSVEILNPEVLAAFEAQKVWIWSAPGINTDGALVAKSRFTYGPENEDDHDIVFLVPFNPNSGSADYFIPDCKEFTWTIHPLNAADLDRDNQDGACPP